MFLVIELRQNQEAMDLDRKIALLDTAQVDFISFSEQCGKLIRAPEVAKLYIDGRAGMELNEVDKLRFHYLYMNLYWAAVLMHERADTLGRLAHAEATATWI